MAKKPKDLSSDTVADVTGKPQTKEGQRWADHRSTQISLQTIYAYE